MTHSKRSTMSLMISMPYKSPTLVLITSHFHWVRVHSFYWIFCCPFNSFLWLQSSSGQNKNNNFSEYFFLFRLIFFSWIWFKRFLFYLNLIQFQCIFLNNFNHLSDGMALHSISNFRSITLKSIFEFYESNIF